MTSKERDEKIRRYFGQDMDLLRAKGHDYAGEADSLANLKRFGALGIAVRLSDKFSRLEQFAKSGKLLVADEGVIDTLRDIRNYCFFMQIFLEKSYPTDPEDYQGELICEQKK